jgi:hypothetical protein
MQKNHKFNQTTTTKAGTNPNTSFVSDANNSVEQL